MQYTLVGTEEGSNITVFVPGRAPLVAHSTHPNFDSIVSGVVAGDESVVDLFDIAQTSATKFERLTERITTQAGRLFLDGVRVENALSTQVVRFLREGIQDWKPLVNFFENVQQNPNEHSREQLYTWLEERDFTITPDGLIVGYKGVRSTDGGSFMSINTGRAIVDGEVMTGTIPNAIGSVIEMPRDEVQFDPSVGCHTGLHVGTYEYAEDFAKGALLEVHVNPRDVVSVPTDCDHQKMRVCRYVVVDTIDAPHTVSVLDYYNDEDDGWGDGHYDVFDDPDDPTDVLRLLDNDTGCRCPDCMENKEVADLGDDDAVVVGDVFEDRDSRRSGRTFRVESIDGEFAVGKSLPTNLTREVRIDRLTSRKYRKV